MTFTDVLFQRIQIKSSNKKYRPTEQPSERPAGNGKLKRIHESILDLISGYRLAGSHGEKRSDQQQTSASTNSSVGKSSDLERAVSKKTVTFASVFDFLEDEKPAEEHQPGLELTSTDQPPKGSDDDFVTVISNKYVDDEEITNANDNAEPYPFRSELQLFPFSDAQSSVKTHGSSHQSRRALARQFICRRRPKKLRHPIKIDDPIPTMNRSRSAPDMLFPSGPSLSSTASVKHRPLRNIRRWMRSLPIGRFVRSFGKQSRPPSNESSTTKPQPTNRSKPRRKTSDLIY